MSYKVITLLHFDKQAKKIAKKYKSLKNELAILFEKLEESPNLGTHLGNNIYKIRLAIQSKGKGKSGGARVMSFVKVINETVYLFSIYNKGEKDNISDEEIKEILQQEGIL